MSKAGDLDGLKGRVFNIQRYSTDDGPGIRSTVFLKGCPLRCLWCSNPESQKSYPEVGHRDALCQQCSTCVKTCSVAAISLNPDGKGVTIDRSLCNNCGECVGVCPQGALTMHGRDISVGEVLEEVKRDEMFYRNTGGGVTASGGEPLFQADFVAALFERCHQVGIPTALDTSGHASRSALKQVLAQTDLVLYDLKCMDNDDSLVAVGQPNKLMLQNAEYVLKSDVPVIIRIALIPGITEKTENLQKIAEFVRRVNPSTPVNVLPYHRLGMSKFRMMDMNYELGDLEPIPEERLSEVADIFDSLKLECEIVT
ncbi:glycyl-radical enzyme activating protein [Chloroflexota bacterium]